MTCPDENPHDDEFAVLLGNYDDALAHGDTPAPQDTSNDLALRMRLDEAQACLALLESAWPRNRTSAKQPVTPVLATSLPTHLARFELRRELGRGGSGVVFLAFDPLLQRLVALKVPRPEILVTEELRRRFQREAKIAARLDHPNLIAIHEVCETGPICCIVTAYCPGPTLAAWLREQRMPPAPTATARLVLQLAGAVAYMHGQGVLHRDIKPGNILLQTSDLKDEIANGKSEMSDLQCAIPKLADFSLAKFTDGATQHTRSGAVLGTPAYMAPEQADGRLSEIGPHTDVYALGVVLYEMLTGQPPFQGTSDIDTVRQVLTEEPRPPWRLRSEVPRDLATICLKCLEKKPRQRYEAASALAGDLRAFLDGKQVRARPVPPWSRAAKWCRRNRAAATLIAVVSLALPALACGVYLHSRQLREYEGEVLEERTRTAEAAVELHIQAYSTSVCQAAVSWANGHNQAAVDALADYFPSPGKEEVRGFEWHYLWSQVIREPRTLLAGHHEWAEIQYSVDGNWCASIGRDLTLKIWDAASGRLRTAMSLQLGQEHLANAVFSNDGARLLCLTVPPPDRDASREFTLWDVAAGKQLARRETRASAYQVLSISPDGRLVAYLNRTNDEDTIWLWNTNTGVDHAFHPNAPINAHCLSFSPDNKRLAIAYPTPGPDQPGPLAIEIWDVTTRQRQGVLQGPTGECNELLFSPDGHMLAAGTWRGVAPKVWLWDVDTGQLRYKLETLSGRLVHLAFSPDGNLLAVGEAAEEHSQVLPGVSLWDMATGTRLARHWQVGSDVGCISFSPNGRTLAIGCTDGQVRLCDLADPPELAVLAVSGEKEAWSVAFSPDGQTLAVGYDDEAGDNSETLKLWDVRTGKERANLRGHDAMVTGVSFAPDGYTLASAGYDKHLKFWDLRSQTLLASFAGHTERIKCLARSPDGRTLATGGRDNLVKLWDATTGREKCSLRGHSGLLHRVCFAPDSKTLVSTDNTGELRFWDTVTGQCSRLAMESGEIIALAYSPSGLTVATGNTSGVVKLWGADDQPRCLLGHAGEARAAAFSPDGRTLATGGEDRTVRLWQFATGRELLVFKDLPQKVNDLAFSPDGHSLAAALHDGSVRLWRAAGEFQSDPNDRTRNK
jgi:WD40 repeat protein/serine/threonine protein kinase